MTATANTERLHTKPFRVTFRKARDHQKDTNTQNTRRRATMVRRTTLNPPAQICGDNRSGKETHTTEARSRQTNGNRRNETPKKKHREAKLLPNQTDNYSCRQQRPPQNHPHPPNRQIYITKPPRRETSSNNSTDLG